MPTLAETIAADWTGLVANTAELAETITFQREGGGPPRSLVAVISEESMVVARNGLHQKDEVILVSVGRDVDSEAGGIDAPILGDKLWRANVFMPELPYNWTGETPDVNPGNWTLRYIRTLPYRATAKR